MDDPKAIIKKIVKVSSNYNVLGIVGHQPQIGKIIGEMFNIRYDAFEILPATLIEVSIEKGNKKNNLDFKLIRLLRPQHILSYKL